MRFSAHSTPEGYEAKLWLDDSPSTIIRFVLPENTLEAWEIALKKVQQEAWLKELVGDLHAANISFVYPRLQGNISDAVLERLAFCKFVLAWRRVYSDDSLSVLDLLDKASALQDFRHTWPFDWLTIELAYREKEEWLHALEKRAENSSKQLQFLADFLLNLDLLRALNCERVHQQPENASALLSACAALVMAVLDFLNGLESEQPHSECRIAFCRFAQNYRPHLWALLAENKALSLEERQRYINNLFTSDISEQKRWPILESVLEDLEQEAGNSPEDRHVVETIASLIAQNYLNRYALDTAVTVWSKVQHLKKDEWLQVILGLYRSPLPWWLAVLAWLGISCLIPVAWVKLVAGVIGLVTLFVGTLFALGGTAARFVQRRGFSWLELFLPRLAGAVLVGLSILALENTVWEISAELSLFPWIMIALAAYLGALAYIFLDVHKTTRLLPLEEKAKTPPEKGAEKLRVSPLMSRSVRTAWRIFAIGALEALVLTALITSFLPLDEQFQGQPITLLNWHRLHLQVFDPYGIVVDWLPFVHLTYFPKIIILWAGMALLLGAFAQLLWQDRQITAS